MVYFRSMRRKALVIFFVALLLQCRASPPLALHQLVEVEPGGEVILNLHGLDFEGDDVSKKGEKKRLIG